MSWAEESKRYHDVILNAVKKHRGEVLTNEEIKNILVNEYPELESKRDWIQFTDHCSNRTNKGACSCAKSYKAIFKWISRGHFKVI